MEETSAKFREHRDEQLFLINFRMEKIDQVGKDGIHLPGKIDRTESVVRKYLLTECATKN